MKIENIYIVFILKLTRILYVCGRIVKVYGQRVSYSYVIRGVGLRPRRCYPFIEIEKSYFKIPAV